MKAHEQAITAPGSVAVLAGAGSGKTHILVERYVELLRRGLRPLEIVVITYTELAASELRARIRQRVKQSHADQPALLAEVEVAQISTIHALAARICRDHPLAARVPNGFTVQDGPDAHIQWEDLRDEALLEVDVNAFSVLEHGRVRRMLEQLLKEPHVTQTALSRQQGDWSALLEDMRRDAWETVQGDPRWKAAVIQVQSDHGMEGDALEKSRRAAVEGLSLISFGEVERGMTMLQGVVVRGGKKAQWLDLEGTREALKTLRELVKSPLLHLRYSDSDAVLAQQIPLLAQVFRTVKDALDRRKRQGRTLEYADLETQALQALQDPEVSHYYTQRWKHVMVDEAQDTSPVQTELLETIGRHCDLTVVGDDQQAIYGFRGAGRDVLHLLTGRVLASGGQTVTLTEGYRSHARLQHRLNEGAQAILGNARALTACRTDKGTTIEPVSFLLVKPEEEANALAEWIAQLLATVPDVLDPHDAQMRPLRPQDIAVLARRWKDLDELREALTIRGISWFVAGGGNLLKTPELLDTWVLLRFLNDPADNVALLSLLRSPHFNVTDQQLEVLRRARDGKEAWWLTVQRSPDPTVQGASTILRSLLDDVGTLSPRLLLQRAESMSDYRNSLGHLSQAAQHLADLQACHSLVSELQEPLLSCNEVVARLTRLISSNKSVSQPPLSHGDAVTLSTIHGAKGLEWPVVALLGLGKVGRTPPRAIRVNPEFGIAFTPENVEDPALYTLLKNIDQRLEQQEEIRLIYVGMTRSRDALLCSVVRQQGDVPARLLTAQGFNNR